MSLFPHKSFLSLNDVSTPELRELLQMARELKQEKRAGVFPQRLKHKNIALLFEKLSTRTRCSFAVACKDEGAQVEFLGKDDIHFGKKESLEDTARVLGRFFDGLVYRGYAQKTAETLAQLSGVPVWNALTDEEHPTQAVADLMTLEEHFSHLAGLRVVYLGDAANNVANSLMVACAMVGAHFVVAAPEKYWPAKEYVAQAMLHCEKTGSTLTFENNPTAAVRHADVLYTDVWISMGFENQPGAGDRITELRPYQVNAELMKATGKAETVFLHCLPANKGFEVSHEVFEGERSLVFEQAENRLHTIKALLLRGLV
ncbi:MAG: ornithine carbamoyltransferase [Betaproteobacteria bacterium]|nr:ornithine carbamoyltransferase [Betaproteobacteria bacterium]